MKSPSSSAFVEPLEARIAPANIFIGGIGTQDTEYTDADASVKFVNTETSPDPISQVVGGGVVGVADTFYLKLEKGDVLFRSTEAGFVPFISGSNGAPLKSALVAFFVDKNQNNEFEVDELTGLSIGNKATVQVSGTVFGDVVANYNTQTGTIGGAGEPNGSAKDLLLNTVSLFSASSVKGDILSGGAIKSIRVTSDVGQILTGSAASGVTFDFNGALEDGGDTLLVAPAAGKTGANISTVSAGDVVRIQAGGGGSGGSGGSVSNVTLISDTNGFIIQAGDGGNGASGKINGGKGGKMANIVINGLRSPDFDDTANNVTQIVAGNGGDATGGGRGGSGGSISGLAYGYELQNGKLTLSGTPLADTVLVKAGDGGDGRSGGNGGKLVTPRVFAAPTGTGNNISVLAGDGGANTVAGGKAGAGGSISDLEARNPGGTEPAQLSFLIVESGDGGTTAGGAGNKGGSLTDANIAAFSMQIRGGNGSSGTIGGSGGSIKNVKITDGEQNILARNVSLDAGGGGNGSVGKGGKGGSLTGLEVKNGDFSTFRLNQISGSGDGGDSGKGTGGAGGSIGGLIINDFIGNGNVATMMLRSGNGGDSGAGSGGKAGSFNGSNEINAVRASILAQGGSGGSAGGSGSGGAGGAINNFAFTDITLIGDSVGGNASATFMGGAGGIGLQNGKGGSGGVLDKINITAQGAVVSSGGAGGVGGVTGAAGGGGKINLLSAFSVLGAVAVEAGDAGASGAKAGAGGAISTANINAATTISVTSGDGRAGGVGGSISKLGFAGTDQVSGSAGAVTIVGGNGSGVAKKAGSGGSISNAVGFVGTTGISLFQGGQGGAAPTKAAPGGSITDLTILGGGGSGTEIRIQGGDASAAASAKVGGSGGSIRGLAIAELEAGTILRRVVGGDGGDGGAKGGSGGSIINARVEGDIGVRSGIGFGYDQMGGIFAGLGGLGATSGAAGNVTDVSADAISAIVAGKLQQGASVTLRNFVAEVKGVILNDTVATLVDSNGTFTNFATANLVGGVVNPSDPGVDESIEHPHANTFDLVNLEFDDTDGNLGFSVGDATNAKTDGFIAALSYINGDTSFRPEALFTRNGAAIVFIDLNNSNGQQRAPIPPAPPAP